MTLSDIKQLSIRDFLSRRGLSPKMERTGYGLYLSPLREEKTPSFKVDYTQNLWYDFGIGEGGSIIDLVMRLENCSYFKAIDRLRNESNISIHIYSPKPCEPAISILSAEPLADPRLLGYLQERAIDTDIAKHYCREVRYFIGGKDYFAIGFHSDSGGWELRNKFFKGSSSPKDIRTVKNGSPTCLLFEGFMDVLSYLTLKKVRRPTVDMVVLNSVHNLRRAEEFLKQHRTIHCFLDNDESGKRALAAVEKLGRETIDQSSFYRRHKDLNEYLIHRKPAVEVKSHKGLKM